RTLTAHCLCLLSHITFTLPPTPLPQQAHLCHCSVCRYTHGTLFTTHERIQRPDVDLSTFKAYKCTERWTIYFCGRCGSHVLDRLDVRGWGGKDGAGEEEVEWYIALGVVDQEGGGKGNGKVDGVWQFTKHIFVSSTQDGGLAFFLTRIGNSNVRLWNSRPIDDPAVGTGELQMQLEVKCHCTSIHFPISRPSPQSKFQGKHCACRSCRFATSTPVASWVYVPTSSLSLPANLLFNSNSKPPSLGPGFGTLQTYTSSPGVTRSFCSTCGACVAVVRDEEKGVVQVAAGLFRAKGVRAEEWVEWGRDVGGLEDG
ncbi:hypothetical protein CC86DRAFT_241596, partial [Ophiobolus disseminans]